MISSRVNELYVWTQINGEPVIVGKFNHTDKVGTFFYANSYIDRQDAYPIDPINLPLIGSKEFHTQANGGYFGVLTDAGPDKWGQKILSELSPSKPRGPLEFLLAGNGDGCGALLFSLSRTSVKKPNLISNSNDISVLEEAAQDILHDESLNPNVQKMIVERSSMGGARPKATVVIDGKHYMAKFNRDEDLFNEAMAESASLRIAKEAGIAVCESKVLFNKATQHNVFLTKRFDFNDDGTKKHYISANSLMNLYKVQEGNPDQGYPGLASIARKICSNPDEASKEVFRRMCFRILMGDTDDHAKNYGFLYNPQTRKFEHSPFFDVLPHANIIGSQAMAVGKFGRASTIKNMLSMCESFGLSKTEAGSIVKNQMSVIKNWRDYYREEGMKESEIKILESCFHIVDGPKIEHSYEI